MLVPTQHFENTASATIERESELIACIGVVKRNVHVIA